MTIYYGHHHLIVLTIYFWYLACVCSALSCFDSTRCLLPFDFILYCLLPHVQLGFGMPWGVSTSTRLLCNIASTRNPKITPLPTRIRECEGFEVRRDTPLPIRRKLAELHQVQTTSSSVSTTTQRMALLLEHIAEDPDAPLLTHTENMLA